MEITSIEELNLRFIDEEAVRMLPSSYLNSFPQMPTNKINFDDVFDVDPSELDSKKQKSNFFSVSNLKNHKQQKHQLTVYLKQNLSNLKVRRKTIHHIPPATLMKNVRNVSLPNDYRQLIRLFINSNHFLYFIRLIIIINFVAISLTDYSFRIHTTIANQLSKFNILSLCLQLFSNCVFTLEIAMRLYQKQVNYKEPYLICNIIGTLATWITIFFDMMKYDDNVLFKIMIMIRITRSIIRILQVTQWLRIPFQAFMKTIPSLQKLFFPFVIISLFYALAGMALFSDSTHYICGGYQTTHFSGKYCGSSMYTCPAHEHCIYITQELPPQASNQYNLVHFNDLGGALLTVYHYVYNSNFHVTRSKFSAFINPYISSVYFISMSIFLFYIFSNLMIISLSKSYLEQVQEKQHKQKTQIPSAVQPLRQASFFQKTVQIFNLIVIIAQTIILVINYQGMSQSTLELQSLLDFSLSWVSLFSIIVMIVLHKKQYFYIPLNCIDLTTLAFHFLDLIICISQGNSVIYNQSTTTIILRNFKILRIIRLIYCSNKFFAYERFVIKVFIQTIIKIRALLLLCLCFAFMFKQYGEVLFAFKVRFNSHGQVDIEHGAPYTHNFQSFTGSLYTIFYLFLNEHWTETMYHYYHAVGSAGIWFHVIVVFVAHMMLIRLYIGVFLGLFKEQLHKKSKLEHQKDISNQQGSQASSQIKKSNHQIKNQVSLSCRQKQNPKQKQVNPDDHDIPANGCFMSVWSSFYHSNKFYFFINTTIFVHILTILVRNSTDSQDKVQVLATIENICFAIYILQVTVGCLIEGIYSSNDSYLRKNKSNVISLIVAIFSLIGYIPLGNQLAHLYIRRITILKIFTLFRQTDKQMSIVVDTIFNIMGKFFNFILIYALFLFIIAVILLKIFGSQPSMFNCQLPFYINGGIPLTQSQCQQQGGYWQQNQYFGNIFNSIAFLYQVVASQSWSFLIKKLIEGNKPFGWQLFFILFFFVYNICFLVIVMGFIVETYLHLKDQAYNLNLLKQSQRCWVLIKNSINTLTPKPVITLPLKASAQRKLIFNIIASDIYLIQLDIMAYVNAALYVITFEGENQFYAKVINYIKYAILFVFVFDVVLKLYALRKKYFELSNSNIQIMSGIFILLYSLATWIWALNYEVQHILKFLLTAVLLLRCKSLLLRFSWCKTHLNAVIDILPKCGKIIKLACAVLFFYAAIGLEVFKYVKTDQFVDNYNMGFDDFLTSILSLVRVSVAEAWYEVVSAFLKSNTSYYQCYSLGEYELAKLNSGMGCGSWIAYPYFLSFHVFMVLLVMNLLIATMASAYDDNYQIQYNSVNIFQLEDCLHLWQKYDPHASGVVHYKKFWRLTSEIAILFGISKKKLIKRKNKFFQELDLQIYQAKNNPILCYRFHDVITKFSKIKLQVANLGHNEKTKQGDNEVDIQFDISPAVLKQIKDYITPFPDHLYSTYQPFKQYKSGETKYIFGLLKKIRHWKHVATEKKRPVGGAKLSSIFDLIAKKNNGHDLPESDQIRIPEAN